jgi:hypothetical protein
MVSEWLKQHTKLTGLHTHSQKRENDTATIYKELAELTDGVSLSRRSNCVGTPPPPLRCSVTKEKSRERERERESRDRQGKREEKAMAERERERGVGGSIVTG